MVDMKTRAEFVRRRKRTVVQCRMRAGFCELLRHPWKLVLLAYLVAMFCILWRTKDAILTPVEVREVPLLAGIYFGAISALIILLFIVFVMGILIAFGTPRSAARIECSLVHIGLTDRYDCGPILVENERIKGTPAKLLTFFSLGISKGAWVQHQQEIEDILNVRWVGSPEYGGKRGDNRNYIVLKVVPGAGVPPREVLYDEL